MSPTTPTGRADRKRKVTDKFLETTNQPKKRYINPLSLTTMNNSSLPSRPASNSDSEALKKLTGRAPSANLAPQHQTTELDPHQVLKTLLEHNQSPSLHLRLTQGAEDNLSRTEADVLLKLLGKMGFAVGTAEFLLVDKREYHCARCHETYIERDNTGSVCVIEHEVFNGEPERQGGDIYHYTCKSCGDVGIEEGGGNGIDWPGDGICYEGQHTQDEEDVDYDGDNTLTCDKNGCPVLHCVRCHETYRAVHNTGYPCCIEHEFNAEPEHCGADVYRYTCKTCGQVGIKNERGNWIDWRERETCYEGEHTTKVEDVSYNGLTCKANGCPVLPVLA